VRVNPAANLGDYPILVGDLALHIYLINAIGGLPPSQTSGEVHVKGVMIPDMELNSGFTAMGSESIFVDFKYYAGFDSTKDVSIVFRSEARRLDGLRTLHKNIAGRHNDEPYRTALIIPAHHGHN
jgi:hypothetical protein